LKEIEELGVLEKADVAKITPEVIGKALELIARPKLVFAQFFKEDLDIMGPGKADVKKYPKEGSGTAYQFGVSEGGTVAASEMTYDRETIRTVKGGMELRFSTEAIETPMRNVIEDTFAQAAKVRGETLDNQALWTMLCWHKGLGGGRATLTWTRVTGSGTVLTTTVTPLLGLKASVSGETIQAIDYYGGTIILTGTIGATSTIDMYYAKLITEQGATNADRLVHRAKYAGTLTVYDLWRARAKMISKANRYPNVAIIHDNDIPGLIWGEQRFKFLEVSAYPEARRVIYNAEIGTLAGMRIITSTRGFEGVAILLESPVGYNLIKRRLKFYREEKWQFDQLWFHGWEKFNFGIVEPTKVGLIVNAQADAWSRA